jgi:hypothetical protein
MNLKYAALVFLVPLLASCETLWPTVPETPIYATDKVKTEADAINLGRRNCGFEADDPEHWHAVLRRDVWMVWWQNGLGSIGAAIRKNDGVFESCEVDDDRKLEK